ncbi:MAG: ComEC/Rec2 family competence protein [Acidimicrobiales bacterium]
MNDLQAVLVAGACGAGALAAVDLPLWPLVVVAVAAAVIRRPWLLIVALALLASARAADAWTAVAAPMPAEVDARASLVRDPVRSGAATTVLVAVDGRNLVATAYGPAGARLGRAQAGDRVQLQGTTRSWAASSERHAALRTTHRLDVDAVTVLDATPALWRLANEIRDRIADGAEPLGEDRRALFTGLVYGDDRFQSALVEADFRLAGLTHLLAVSGQNVAYLLILLAPILRRCGLGWRWILTIAALVVFATATRYEPSVLRATVMAAIAATGALTGRESPSVRVLAFAVAGLILMDPLLAHTIAFRLSVAASAGIIVFAKPMARRFGDGPVAAALAVTVSAQLAVAPLLVTTFGPVSIVSIPANLLAGPAAGLAMAWGMTAGLAAGLVGGPLPALVHTITAPLLWWLEHVAHASASVPLAPVGLAWIVGALVTWFVADGVLRIPASPLVVVVAAVVLVGGLRVDVPEGRTEVGPGSHVVARDDTVVLVVAGRSNPVWLLEDLRRIGVRRVALLVGADGRDDVDAVLARLRVDRRWNLANGSDGGTDPAGGPGPWFSLGASRARLHTIDGAVTVELAPP